LVGERGRLPVLTLGLEDPEEGERGRLPVLTLGLEDTLVAVALLDLDAPEQIERELPCILNSSDTPSNAWKVCLGLLEFDPDLLEVLECPDLMVSLLLSTR
jgi:hypothetical protein